MSRVFTLLLLCVVWFTMLTQMSIAKTRLLSTSLENNSIEADILYSIDSNKPTPTSTSELETFLTQHGTKVTRLSRTGGRFLHLTNIFNDTQVPSWVIEVKGKKLKHIEFHILTEENHQTRKSGYYAEGDFVIKKGRNFYLPPGQFATLIIEYKDTYFPKSARHIHLMPQSDYSSMASNHLMILAFLSGTLLILIIYSFVLAYQQRTTTLLYYGLYIACHLTGFSIHFGVLQYWFDMDFYRWHTFPFMLAITCNIIFTVRFLQLPEHYPGLTKLLRSFALICLILAPLSVLIPVLSKPAFIYAPLIWACFCIVSGFIKLRSGYRPAVSFCIAYFWFVLPLVVILGGHNTFFEFRETFDVELLVFVGAGLEALFLAIAIIHVQKLSTDNKEKFRNQLEKTVQKRTLALTKAQQSQGKLVKDLQRAGLAKNHFLANMSHEIRTPLTAIIGYSEALLNSVMSHKEIQNAHKVISENSSHLLDVINNILSITKLESGDTETYDTDISLIGLINNIETSMAKKAAARGIKIMIEHQYPLPEQMTVDEMKLTQSLTNLLTNAIKFTHTGSVTLKTKVVEQQLEFQVTDTGIGMTKEQLKRIFTPFSQGDYGVRRKYGGTGLGLSLCQRYIEQMKGSITVESEVKQGSTFSVRLPLSVPADSPWYTQPIANQQNATKKISSHEIKLRVLLVDDHQQNREFIALLLNKHGVSVTQADNGKSAVVQAKENKFDLILMDIQMPIMDGITAFKNIRLFDCETPIAALTANNMLSEINEYKKIGFSHYIQKPIQLKAILDVLNQTELDKEATANGKRTR